MKLFLHVFSRPEDFCLTRAILAHFQNVLAIQIIESVPSRSNRVSRWTYSMMLDFVHNICAYSLFTRPLFWCRCVFLCHLQFLFQKVHILAGRWGYTTYTVRKWQGYWQVGGVIAYSILVSFKMTMQATKKEKKATCLPEYNELGAATKGGWGALKGCGLRRGARHVAACWQPIHTSYIAGVASNGVVPCNISCLWWPNTKSVWVQKGCVQPLWLTALWACIWVVIFLNVSRCMMWEWQLYFIPGDSLHGGVRGS